MTPRQFHDMAVIPGLSLLPSYMTSPEARALLVAIAMVESGVLARQQVGGTAISMYQFEEIGIDNVFTHADTGLWVMTAASALAIPVDEHFYAAVKWNDCMATVIARLILWLDPARLPALGQEQQAYSYYCKTWMPGKPSAARRKTAYNAAMVCVKAVP